MLSVGIAGILARGGRFRDAGVNPSGAAMLVLMLEDDPDRITRFTETLRRVI
jgi:hypothetical protein